MSSGPLAPLGSEGENQCRGERKVSRHFAEESMNPATLPPPHSAVQPHRALPEGMRGFHSRLSGLMSVGLFSIGNPSPLYHSYPPFKIPIKRRTFNNEFGQDGLFLLLVLEKGLGEIG